MMRRKTVLTLLVAGLALLAGCSTGTGGTPTGTPTATETTTSTPTPPTSSVVERAISATERVDTYRVNATQSITIEANLAQTIDLRRNVSVNRTANRAHVSTWQSSRVGTTTADTYLVNGTLYQRSQAFVRQFSSEWIKIDVSENVSSRLRSQDALAQQTRILNGTSFERNGTAIVDGVETIRLETSGSPGDIEDVVLEQLDRLGLGLNESTYSLESGSYTFWISTETYRPMKVSGHLNSSITLRGQAMRLVQTFEFRYDYGTPVSIELPSAARNAVSASEALNASRSGG